MKRLDLIIDELSDICEDVNCQCSIAEALAVARELRELKPVAWMYPDDLMQFESGEKVAKAYNIKRGSPISGITVPLYALGDEK